jgi:hypothetical protein
MHPSHIWHLCILKQGYMNYSHQLGIIAGIFEILNLTVLELTTYSCVEYPFLPQIDKQIYILR